MADDIIVTLRADISDIQRDLNTVRTQMAGISTQATQTGKKAESSIGGAMKSIGPQILGAFSVAALIGFGKKVLDITAQFQKMEAVLTNTLGGSGAAQKALKDIQKFAAETNFSVLELTESYVKLANQGFKPTTEELRKLADVANSTGKSFDQLTEAIIDAQTGEFERLKEFGIRAQKEGDKVTFTFKGIQTQTKFTNDSIREYILSLGDLKGVSGSTAAISKTLGGQISNLGDAMDAAFKSIGDSSTGILGGVIGGFTDLLNKFAKLNELAPSEELKKEQTELNFLVGQITNANSGQAYRNRLINELQEKYPSFLANIKEEDRTNSNLSKRLEEVNKQYIARIAVGAQEEKRAASAKIIFDLGEKEYENQKLQNQQLEKGIAFLKESGMQISENAFKFATTKEKIELVSEALKKLQDETESKDVRFSEKAGYRLLAIDGSTKLLEKSTQDLNTQRLKQADLDARLLEIQNKYGETLKVFTKEQEEANKKTADGVTPIKDKTKALDAYQLAVKKVTDAEEKLKVNAASNITSNEDIDNLAKAKNELERINKEIALNIELGKKIEKRGADTNFAEDITPPEMQDTKPENLKKPVKKETEEEKQARIAKFNQQQEDIDQAQVLGNTLADLDRQLREQRISEIQAAADKEQEILDNKLKNHQLTEKQYQAQSLALQKRTQEEVRKERVKQFNIDKALALVNISIDTAQGVAKALTLGPVGSAIAIPLIAGIGAAQLALVASQEPPKYEKGGKIKGRRHSFGGVLIEAEGGEYISPIHATSKYLPELEAMKNNTFERMKQQEWIQPAIKKAKKEYESDIKRALSVNANLNDSNLIVSDMKTRDVLYQILEATKGKNSNNIRFRNV